MKTALLLLCLLAGAALGADGQLVKEGETSSNGLICHGGILVCTDYDIKNGMCLQFGCDFNKERAALRTKLQNEAARAHMEREYERLKKQGLAQ